MTTPLREHPHLPVLPLTECFALFEQARLNFNQLKALTGYSRMSLYLWRRGERQPQSHSMDRVSTLAHKIKCGLELGVFPVPGRPKIDRLLEVLDTIHLT